MSNKNDSTGTDSSGGPRLSGLGKRLLVRPITVIVITVSIVTIIAVLAVLNLVLEDYFQGQTFYGVLGLAVIIISSALALYFVFREWLDLRRVRHSLKDSEQVNRRLELLQRFGGWVGSTLEPNLIVEMILEYALEETDAEIGAVYLILDKDGDSLKLVTLRGAEERELIFKEFPMGKGLLGQAAESRELVAIDDMGAVDERDNVFFGAAQPSSQLMVPLAARDKFVGMVVTGNREPHSYSDDEKRMMEGIAELGGLAIANAELYRIARKSLDVATQQRGVTESVLGKMVAGVITCDRQGRISDFNDEAERLTGYTFTEMNQVMLKPELSLDENPLGPIEHGMLEVLKGPETVKEGEALVMKKDKAMLPISYRIYPLSDGEEMLGAAAVFMESGQRERESAAKPGLDYQILLRSLGARVERLYTHPLSRVLDRVRGMDIDSWSRSREDIVNILEAGSAALLGLLEDVEQYLNCVAVREWDAKEEHDVRGLVAEVVEDVLRSWASEKVLVAVDIPDLPPIYGYKRMIKSALSEVVENAVMASLSVDGKVEISGCREGSLVRIVVRDSGPGITAGTQEFIYLPFFTTEDGRSGLGLSIVRRVMNNTGGRAGLLDADVGTAFYLDFPTAPRPPETGGSEGYEGTDGAQ